MGYQVRPKEKEEVRVRVFYAHTKQITWKKSERVQCDGGGVGTRLGQQRRRR